MEIPSALKYLVLLDLVKQAFFKYFQIYMGVTSFPENKLLSDNDFTSRNVSKRKQTLY